MALYDYGCAECDNQFEISHPMSDPDLEMDCIFCKETMVKFLNTGAPKRPDAPWIKDINGAINDLTEVQRGRQPEITNREQARTAIKRVYSDSHPAVRKLRQRYLERF